jgi:hypothetical protein
MLDGVDRDIPCGIRSRRLRVPGLDRATRGRLTGAGSSGCTFSGSITPRASGKAVYNVSVTFAGGVCLLGTQTITGIAAVAGSGAAQALYAAALNSARSAGFALISTR